MLANSLAILTLIACVVVTLLDAGLATTRAMTHRLASNALDAGYKRALSALIRGVQSASPVVWVPPLCTSATSNGCVYRTWATIATSAESAGAFNQQANAYVNERRVSAHITVYVSAPDGAPLAHRSTDVLLRLTDAPPYVSVSGARDGTFDDVVAQTGPGDDGGLPSQTPDPCASAEAGSADYTVVRVAYVNAETGACTDGSSWR